MNLRAPVLFPGFAKALLRQTCSMVQINCAVKNQSVRRGTSRTSEMFLCTCPVSFVKPEADDSGARRARGPIDRNHLSGRSRAISGQTRRDARKLGPAKNAEQRAHGGLSECGGADGDEVSLSRDRDKREPVSRSSRAQAEPGIGAVARRPSLQPRRACTPRSCSRPATTAATPSLSRRRSISRRVPEPCWRLTKRRPRRARSRKFLHARRVAARKDQALLAVDEPDQPIAPAREEAEIRRAIAARTRRKRQMETRGVRPPLARSPRARPGCRRSAARDRARADRVQSRNAASARSWLAAMRSRAPLRRSRESRADARSIASVERDPREPLARGGNAFDQGRARGRERGALPASEIARAPPRNSGGTRGAIPMPRDRTSRTA